MVQTVESATLVRPDHGVLPYPPSWVDRLTAWIAQLPGPAWLYYLVGVILLRVAYGVVLWSTQNVSFAMQPHFLTVFAVTGFYYLASIHYRDELARAAMERFRPAIDAPTRRVAELKYRLTTMPPKMVWLMTLLGILLGVILTVGVATGALTYPVPPLFSSLGSAVVGVATTIFISLFFVLGTYHTVHQLRTVSMIYTELTNINLFEQTPLHAFATLAAYTVIGWLLLQYFWLTAGVEEAAFTLSLGFLVAALALGVVAFTWPLLGIHRLLVAEKGKLQSAANRRFQHYLQLSAQALDRGDLSEIDNFSKAIDSAERECRVIAALPTWPWQAGMLRSAVTALLLPMILWLATRILESLFGA